MAASSNHELIAQLEKHPQLLARIKKLLNIVDAKGEDNINTQALQRMLFL